MTRPTAIPATPYAGCAALLPGYQFADAFQVPAPAGVDAIEATRLAFAHGPWWIRTLMGVRNGIVRLFGLKAGPASGFPVIRQSADEVVLGFNDKHLDFRIVVVVAGGTASITTVVRWHNVWGRTYLALIMPFHRVIAARLLEGIG